MQHDINVYCVNWKRKCKHFISHYSIEFKSVYIEVYKLSVSIHININKQLQLQFISVFNQNGHKRYTVGQINKYTNNESLKLLFYNHNLRKNYLILVYLNNRFKLKAILKLEQKFELYTLTEV